MRPQNTEEHEPARPHAGLTPGGWGDGPACGAPRGVEASVLLTLLGQGWV